MNESLAAPTGTQQNADRYKTLIVTLTVFTTVLASVLAALQADANIRADVANRESQYLAILATGESTRAGLESNYELAIFGDYFRNVQETTILELTALEQEERGENQAARASRELALLSQARADTGEKFSIFYTDPRYAPQSENDMPKMDQYAEDVFAKAIEISLQQKETTEVYHAWDLKADSYITALTVLAVAFFLFGLGQAVKETRLRLIFAAFGVMVIVFSLLITATTLLQ